MVNAVRRVAINTGGGDAPGLNAVLHGAVYAARGLGWQIFGIRDGYDGFLEPQNYPDGGLIELRRSMVREISHLGGTILGTTNRGNPFCRQTKQPDGTVKEVDRSDELIECFRKNRLDALIAVGGDGSLSIADKLHKKGLCVIGVPKTIDNDLESTVLTFGFNTAVSFATECIDRLHSTAMSHQRVIVVEVMGRYVGWIALHSGLAGRADAILIPEIPYKIEKVAAEPSTQAPGRQTLFHRGDCGRSKTPGRRCNCQKSRDRSSRTTRRDRRDGYSPTSGTHREGEPLRGFRTPIARRIAYGD